ncbi:MAG: M1 family aminopeptidase, partial [Gemmatimonadaceae bacterium]
VQRTANALRWLESIYGPYAYPQMTVIHRIEGGGTEFPMLQANGSPSQGLILHEGGHIWSYGILANNEWRSGWMDEGLTSYQTAWAQGLTPQERVRAGTVDEFAPITGYRGLAIRMRLPRFEALNLGQAFTDLQGNAEPIGTIAHEFRDFGTYNDMVYSRAEVMYGELRDAVGDSAFRAFLDDYYARWALKHVDERAMRGSSERATGKDLTWFFQQWVHETGVTDYALEEARTMREGGGSWVTDAVIVRRGEYRHPMSVGVRTASGWTLARMSQPPFDRETVLIRTTQEPLEVRLDPFHFSWDWDRRNDVRQATTPLRAARARVNFDWPFLDQADRERDVVLFAPIAWYSEAGAVAAGIRERGSYLGAIDRTEGGIAYYFDPNEEMDASDQLQLWWRFWNLYLPGMSRPAMGMHGGIGHLDAILRFELGREWRREAGRTSRAFDVTLNYTNALEPRLAPTLWTTNRDALDAGASLRWQRETNRGYVFVEPELLAGVAGDDWYGKAQGAVGLVVAGDRTRSALRLYGGISETAIEQRALFLSVEDPMDTYWNHWWRPRGALLKRPGFNFLPLGGAGLRGYAAGIAVERTLAANADVGARLFNVPAMRSLGVWLHGFGDVATMPGFDPLADAGVGIALRGRLFDRAIHVRIDAPFYVSEPALSIGDERTKSAAARWVLTFRDLW